MHWKHFLLQQYYFKCDCLSSNGVCLCTHVCVFVHIYIHVHTNLKSSGSKHWMFMIIYDFNNFQLCVSTINKYMYFIQVNRAVWEEMVNACWCGLLAALSLLLDARYLVFHLSWFFNSKLYFELRFYTGWQLFERAVCSA